MRNRLNSSARGAWLLPCLFVLLTPPLLAQKAADLAVRYRSADTVYLNAGRAAGLEVGDRLEVLRDGQVIAEIEVIFRAEHSASCRILNERQAIRPDDRVRRIGDAAPSPPAPAPPPPASSPAPQPSTEEPAPSLFGTRDRSRPSRTRLTGAVSLDMEGFSDGTEDRRDFTRTAARLNLRVRDIAGSPLQVRLRLRTLDEERERRLSGGIPESQSRDRLYELALIYEPEEARYGFRLGRLGTSPFTGIGYLDGGLAQVRLVRQLELGGFYGRRPVIEELGFDGSGAKYGLFARLAPTPEEGGREPFELLLAGIREEGETDVSREYVAVESRYDPGRRWTFYQRAEVDLNTGWREQAAGNASQLSQLSLSALGRLSERRRLVISYDRFERYRTEETRFIPTELFDDLMRQGLRVSFQSGPPRGLNLSVTAGARSAEAGGATAREGDGDPDTSYSLGGGAWHPELTGLKLFAGADVLGFTNPFTEGLLVTGRLGRRFAGGHEVSVALGGTLTRESLLEEERSTQWARASLWLELPLDLFGEAELEVLTGDQVEGQRLRLGLGYRF
jgi:hypothetical protein